MSCYRGSIGAKPGGTGDVGNGAGVGVGSSLAVVPEELEPFSLELGRLATLLRGSVSQVILYIVELL